MLLVMVFSMYVFGLLVVMGGVGNFMVVFLMLFEECGVVMWLGVFVEYIMVVGGWVIGVEVVGEMWMVCCVVIVLILMGWFYGELLDVVDVMVLG